VKLSPEEIDKEHPVCFTKMVRHRAALVLVAMSLCSLPSTGSANVTLPKG